MIDLERALTKVVGVFRKAAEISLQILRTNSESLMTVLEAFVHDPLVEWTKHVRPLILSLPYSLYLPSPPLLTLSTYLCPFFHLHCDTLSASIWIKSGDGR